MSELLKNSFELILQRQRDYHIAQLKQSTAVQRIAKLRLLEKTIWSYADKIRQALYEDSRKSATEVDLTELLPVLAEIKHAIRKGLPGSLST